MSLTRVSDPSLWCHAELDEGARLMEAVELLEADLSASPDHMPFSQLSEALLEVWDLAVQLGPEVAGPLEDLLCELLSRHRSGRRQIASALAEVRHRLDDTGPVAR
ncbi:MAG: hypothetical protein ACYCS2_09510 [Acidimicrobiales bacterium]